MKIKKIKMNSLVRIKNTETVARIQMESRDGYVSIVYFGKGELWDEADIDSLELISKEEFNAAVEKREAHLKLINLFLKETEKKIKELNVEEFRFSDFGDDIRANAVIATMQEVGWLPSRFCD